MELKRKTIGEKGQLTIQVLIFSAVAIIMISGIIIWTDANLKSAYRNADQRSAFMIAEAGMEYYRWHLAHGQQDYQDGTGTDGPYTHDYYDKDGNIIGQFILEITPPPVGSTVVTIRSTGHLNINPGVEKILETQLAIPSFAKYAAVLNAIVRFGEGTEVFGPIHSNGGIRFDGLAHNLVTSGVPTYNDPDHTGSDEFGVHTHLAPVDPIPSGSPLPTPPARPTVFMTGRQIDVPDVDFTGITQDLSTIASKSKIDGFYRGPSGGTNKGYEIILRTDDKFDLYRVSTTMSPPSYCSNTANQDGWGTWTVQNRTSLGTFNFPNNGLIFIEDDVWVRGQINSARLTIASARFPDNPSTRSSITVNSDTTYTNYDGQDVLSLIAQKNLNIGMVSDTDLRLDAALMAQKGRVGRYYYPGPGGGRNRCYPYNSRNIITSYGMIGSAERYGFAYTDGNGYHDRNLIYDANLLYGPPPSFPLTADFYTTISWREIK